MTSSRPINHKQELSDRFYNGEMASERSIKGQISTLTASCTLFLIVITISHLIDVFVS